MKVTRLTALVFFIVFFGGFTVMALASDYPSKPLHIIINYSAGGGHDTMARAFQKPLSTISSPVPSGPGKGERQPRKPGLTDVRPLGGHLNAINNLGTYFHEGLYRQ